MSLDGVNDFVSVPDAPALTLRNTGTIEAWVKLRTINRWHSIVAKGTANLDSAHNYGMEVVNNNRFVCILGNGNASKVVTSAAVAVAGQFYHVACVWNGTNLQLYVNGALDSSTAQNIVPAARTAPVTIGRFGGNADPLSGVVDEVRIYNRALTSSEVQTDMNTPVGGTPPTADNTPPAVALTAPVNGASVSGPVTVTGNATDNNAVAGVQFLADGNLISSEDAVAPYSVNWDSTKVTNGSHNLTARARDAAGNLSTSAAIAVTVNNPATPPGAHQVDITWSPGASTVVGYNIYRGTASQGPYQPLNGSTQPSASFSDMTVTSGMTYYYVVTAVDSGGRESNYSNVATAAIPNP